MKTKLKKGVFFRIDTPSGMPLIFVVLELTGDKVKCAVVDLCFQCKPVHEYKYNYAGEISYLRYLNDEDYHMNFLSMQEVVEILEGKKDALIQQKKDMITTLHSEIDNLKNKLITSEFLKERLEIC